MPKKYCGSELANIPPPKPIIFLSASLLLLTSADYTIKSFVIYAANTFPMRLLTHNVLRNNTAAAKGSNSPLRITATEVRVDEPTSNDDTDAQRREIEFAKNMLPALNWDTLIEGAKAMGLDSLPPSVTPELANDEGFLRALYHVLMDVHLVNGMLVCTETGKEFPVTDGIANFMLEEHECEVPK